MITAAEIYRGLCHTTDPSAAVRALSGAELLALAEYLDALPDAGFPGAAKCQVIAEQAHRWRRLWKSGHATTHDD